MARRTIWRDPKLMMNSHAAFVSKLEVKSYAASVVKGMMNEGEILQ
jgi:hypothetical protein